MTLSTSDGRLPFREIAKRSAPALVIAIVLVAAASLQGRLTLGVSLYLAMIVVMTVTRALITGGTALPVARSTGDLREAVLIRIVMLGSFVLPAFFIATPFLDFATYGQNFVVLAVGVVFGVAGLWLFWRSHKDLGRLWSVALELREGHMLVTDGVYRLIRHPMYSAVFLITVAQAAFIANWIAGPAGFISFLILYLARIGHEERMMSEAFGAEWTDYCGRTGRLVPQFSR